MPMMAHTNESSRFTALGRWSSLTKLKAVCLQEDPGLPSKEVESCGWQLTLLKYEDVFYFLHNKET